MGAQHDSTPRRRRNGGLLAPLMFAVAGPMAPACTVYYLALRSSDDTDNEADIPDTLSFRTLCSGGGGLSARQVGGGPSAAGAAAHTVAGSDRDRTATARP